MVVIDDDPQTLAWVDSALKRPDIDIRTATDSDTGLDLIRRCHPQIALVNPSIVDSAVNDLLAGVLSIDPNIDTILMTEAAYSSASAIEAIERGACEYLPKPLAMERLRQKIDRLIQESERRKIVECLDRELSETCRFEGFVGRSPVMLDVFARLACVAPHYRTALIGGLPGTGKKLAARTLHGLSPAASGPFSSHDCGSLQEIGAGFFHAANGGTLFLNDIDRLPLPLQRKLFRFLQNFGQQKPNLRVIASTSRDLTALVRARDFRLDLLQRLSTVNIRLPALRQRSEDLPLLLQHFLKEFAEHYEKTVVGLTRRAERALYAYQWPGNVQELEDAVRQAVMSTQSWRIDLQDLPAAVQKPYTVEKIDLVSVDAIQYLHTRRVLDFFNGDKTKASEILKVSRATLYRLLAHARSLHA